MAGHMNFASPYELAINTVKNNMKYLQDMGIPCLFIYCLPEIKIIGNDWLKQSVLKQWPQTADHDTKLKYSPELNNMLKHGEWFLCYPMSQLCMLTYLLNAPSPNESKDCYNYLYLDPRVFHELSLRADFRDPEATTKMILSNFHVFVRSIFYIGKGKKDRAMDHLKDVKKEVLRAIRVYGYQKRGNFSDNTFMHGHRAKSLRIHKESDPSDKERRIMDIWLDGGGPVVLKVFENIRDCEATTREAAMIDAMDKANLTNERRSTYNKLPEHIYWEDCRKNVLGSHLLYRAYEHFMSSDPIKQSLYTDVQVSIRK